jgi:CHAD domain-containing protein
LRTPSDGYLKDVVVASSAPAELLGVALEEQLVEIDRTETEVRQSADPVAVHDMRVAVRRLRATLRALRPLLDADWVDGLRRELEWIGDQLGSARDLDVLARRLRADADGLDDGDAVVATTLLRPLSDEQETARTELAEALESERYRKLLRTLRQASASPPLERDDVSLHRLAAKEFRRLCKRGDISPHSSSAALHKRRIRIKRARYTAELAVKAGAGREVEKFVRAAKDAQDVFGAHHDAVLARQRLRELSRVSGRADVGLVAGRLIGRQQRRIERARGEIPEAWERLCRRGKRAWRD